MQLSFSKILACRSSSAQFDVKPGCTRSSAHITRRAGASHRCGSKGPSQVADQSRSSAVTTYLQTRRHALQQLSAAAALAAVWNIAAPTRRADALTVADVTPPVVVSPPLPAREQAVVDGE